MLRRRRRRLGDDDRLNGLSKRLLTYLPASSRSFVELHSLILMLLLIRIERRRHRIAPRLSRESLSTPSFEQRRSRNRAFPLLFCFVFKLPFPSESFSSSCDG